MSKSKNKSMKKLLFIIVVIISINSFGQKHFVGFQSGVNFSYLESDLNGDLKPLSSFSTGLLYEYQFKKGLLLGSGLLYERKGYKTDVMYFPEGLPFMNADLTSTNDFIAIPVKAGYSFGKKWNGFAHLGILTSYLLKSKSRYSYSNSEVEYDVTNNLSRFEVGGILEIGTGYMLTDRLNLFLNTSYVYAFNDISKDSHIENKLHRFNLSLGVKYSLKSKE